MITTDTNLHDLLKEDIYYQDTILEKMENLRKLDPSSSEYNKLYQEIISVGEFPIEKKKV